MNYKETLEKARELDIDIFALHIADETGAIFGEDHPEFEKLCSVMSELYLNTYHMSCETLGNALRFELNSGEVKLSDIVKGSDAFDLVVELACSMD